MTFPLRPDTELYQRLVRVKENPEIWHFSKKIYDTRKELRNIITALESQQSSVRLASGVTGGLTVAGIALTPFFPPVGLVVAGVGAITFGGTHATDVVLNKKNDDRLIKPLIDSNFETEVANFLQQYGTRWLIVAPPLRGNFIAEYCSSTILQWTIFEVGIPQ